MVSVVEKLEGLELAGLAEIAQKVLSDVVQIDDPKEAAARVAELAGLPSEAIAEVEAMAQQTGRRSPDELRDLLCSVLADLAATGPADAERVLVATDKVGSKQIVVGPELYAVCALLVAGYVAVRTGGKKAATRDIELSEGKDGRIKIRIRERVQYLNPFAPLADLLKRVTKGQSNE